MLTISELKLTKEHDIARFFVVVLNIEFIPEYVDHKQDDNKETKSGGYQWESDVGIFIMLVLKLAMIHILKLFEMSKKMFGNKNTMTMMFC